MALAPVDEVGEDLDGMDFTIQTCKDKIMHLQADRERRLEATERLQEKLKALNNELAARRLEAEQRKMELKEEQNRNKQHALMKREMGEGADGLVLRRDEDQSKVRNKIEEMIQEKTAGPTGKEKQKTEYGFRVFDETELMVEKPMEAQSKETPVDTVLVTHQKPNSDDVRYHLSYRVAKETPSKRLREDACNYWNLSEVEYILLTVENSKVHDDVSLQHCFRPNERCQLILAPKDPRRQVLMDMELEATMPKRGKGSKPSKKADKVATEDPSKKYNQAGQFIDWMQARPGVWEFMTQRDRNVVEHITRIKPRSIIVYLFFILASLVSFLFVNPASKGYYMRHGPLLAMTRPHIDSATGEVSPGYFDIKTQEQAWHWLTHIVSEQLMKPESESDIRAHNYIAGWLRVRMQQVGEPSPANCMPQDMAPSDSYCVSTYYDSASYGEEDLDFVRMYWDGYNHTTTVTTTTTTCTFDATITTIPGCIGITNGTATSGGRRLPSDPVYPGYEDEGNSIESIYSRRESSDDHLFDADSSEEERRRLIYSMAPWTENHPYTSDEPTVQGTDGRSSSVSPWKFSAADKNSLDHNQGPLSGLWQKYDASGYNLDYNLSHSNLTAMFNAYRADMLALRERGWWTNRTRSIIVSFTLFSSNYEMWLNSEYVLETPASAIVHPVIHVNTFRPSYKDLSNSQTIFWIDNIRLLFSLFILCIQIYSEIGYCKKAEESWLTGYLITPLGVADVGIVVFMLMIYVIRQILLGFVEEPVTFLQDIIDNENGFMGTMPVAHLYRLQLQMEGPLFCCLVFRFFSFLRINRQIYIIWATLVEAARLYLPFCLVLTPVLFGMVVWAHGLWHSTQRMYSSIPTSAMSVVMMVHGDIDVQALFRAHRPDTLVFGILLYVVVWLFLINAWVAVMVHVYQTTRVRAGYQPSDYKWEEKHYVKWSLWRPFAKIYFNVLRPHIEKPKDLKGDDDDDDDK